MLSHAFPSADFAQVDERGRSGSPLTVVFFGGSLTWGSQATDPQETSYRARIAVKFEAEYPRAHFRFRDASIGGTGSQLAAFRLERDVLAHKPDLVFLDFTINDGPYEDMRDPDRVAAYESVVRRLVLAGIPVVQLLFPAKRDVLPDPPARPLDVLHKEIAAAYGLPSADVVEAARRSVRTGETTPDFLWDNPRDMTHPGDNGYALYAEEAWKAYRRGVASSAVCRAPAKMIHEETYMSVNRWRLSSASGLPEGWAVGLPSRNGIAYDFIPSRWMDDMVIGTRRKEGGPSPAPLVLRVRGRDVFLFGEADPQFGKYQVRIDGGEPKEFGAGSLATHWNMRYVEKIAGGLDPGREHTVEILPLLDPGQDLHFESICVAGAPASVSLK